MFSILKMEAWSKTKTRLSSSRALVFTLIVLLVVVLFVRYYAKTPPQLTVLQVTAAGFHPDLLMEKQPILIEDRVLDSRQLMAKALRYYYLFLREDPATRLPAVTDDDNTDTDTNTSEKKEDEPPPLCTYALATFISPTPRRGRRRVTLRATCLRDRTRSVDFVMHPLQILVLPAHWEVRRVAVKDDGKEGQDDGIRVVKAYDMLHLALYPAAKANYALWCSDDAGHKSTKS